MNWEALQLGAVVRSGNCKRRVAHCARQDAESLLDLLGTDGWGKGGWLAGDLSLCYPEPETACITRLVIGGQRRFVSEDPSARTVQPLGQRKRTSPARP